MKVGLVFSWFLFCILPAAAQAAEYPAGSIGYVYERCQADLKDSRSEAIFQKTYCGQFFAGFIPAVIGSNWILLGSVPEDATCKEELEKAHEFIRGKPKTAEEIKQADEERKKSHKLLVMVKWFDGMKSLLEQEGRKEEVLAQPVQMSWKYFYSLDESKIKNFEKDYKIDIHPDLLKDTKDMEMYSKKPERSWGEVYSIQETYDLCLADVIKARGSEARFSESICGAGILGVLTGMLSIKRMELRPPVVGECKETIDKFFKQFEIKEKFCLTEKLRAIDAASVFIHAADEGFPDNSQKKENDDESEDDEDDEVEKLKIDRSKVISPMSAVLVAGRYKNTCEWKDLLPFDYKKYRTYNE